MPGQPQSTAPVNERFKLPPLWMKHVLRGGEPCFADSAEGFWSNADLRTS